MEQCSSSRRGADPGKRRVWRIHAGVALVPVSIHQLGPQLQSLLVSADKLSARQKVSDAEAIRLIGLGTWRLRGHMGPLFEGLAAQIEGAWRHKVPGLGLGPLPRVRFHTSHAAVQPALLQQALLPQHALVLSSQVSLSCMAESCDGSNRVEHSY